MLNNSRTERTAIARALELLDEWFDTNDTVNTAFGLQYTMNGYQISKIQVLPPWIKLDVYVLDRSVQKKDFVRNGDEVSFTYDRSKDKLKIIE